MPEVLVGRQPIFDRDLSVFGYELLFRSGDANRVDVFDGAAATGQVVLNGFLEIGLDRLVGAGRAFINFPRELLLGDAGTALPSDRVVLEVLETVTPDSAVVEALRALAAVGYVIALDDFSYRPDLEPLLDVCHIVKLDVLALGRDGLRDHIAILKPRGVRLLAEKIDTHADFEFCKTLGFELFQGYFLCRPNVVRGRSVSSNRPAIMQLLARIQQPDIDFDALVADISMDVGLVYKLLRFVNSAACGLSRKVESLRQAAVYVGVSRIRFWASLVLMSSVEDKPRELVSVALQRAKMCELLAAVQGGNEAIKSQCFSVGLFSVLDALLDQPLDELAVELNLSAAVKDALLHRQGLPGTILRSVMAYEAADWDNIACPGVDAGAMKKAYPTSIEWATAALRDLATGSYTPSGPR